MQTQHMERSNGSDAPGMMGAAAAPAAGRGRRILLVEDNEDNRTVYRIILSYWGYQVIEAQTGPEALEHAREGMPDLILMDLSIPVIDGWEATRLLKADPRTCWIPVVALTAHAHPTDCARAWDAGCDGYLTKPVAPSAVLAEVEQRLARSPGESSPATVLGNGTALHPEGGVSRG